MSLFRRVRPTEGADRKERAERATPPSAGAPQPTPHLVDPDAIRAECRAIVAELLAGDLTKSDRRRAERLLADLDRQ